MASSISPGGDLAAIGCVAGVANFVAGGKDTCTLKFAKDSTTAHAYTEGDAVVVTVDSGTLFRGIVGRPARSARGTGEYHTVQLITRWRKLEEIAYTQVYASGASATAAKSRVLVGLTQAGVRQTTQQILQEVLAFANTHGAGITLGNILDGVTLTPPVAELTDVTCAEVIRNTLRWHPDALIYFDHVTDGAINIVLPATLTAVSRAAAEADKAVDAEVYPRGDLLLRGVQIHYETTTVIDGVEYNNITTDTAGATTGARVVHLTLPLQGANITTQSQEIKTRNIPTSSTDAGLAQWLKDKFPEIKAANPIAGQIAAAEPVQVVQTDEEVGPGTTLTSYPRELIKGQVRDFMTGISACPVTWKIKLKYTAAASANPALYKLFTGSGKIEEFSVTVMGTDALTQTYRSTAVEAGDTIPTGLANAYYSAFSSAVQEGTYTRVGGVDLALRPGAKLTLSGRVTVTASPIQSSTMDVFTGRTSCQFGPLNASLNPSDWVELMRPASRTRTLSQRPNTARSTATRSATETLKGATGGRLHNSVRTTTPVDSAFFHCKPNGTGSVAIAKGAVLFSSGGVTTQVDVAAVNVSAGTGDKIWLRGDLSGGGSLSYLVTTGGTPEGCALIAEISTGTDGELVIAQRHQGLLGMPGLRPLQTVVRTNTDGTRQLGLTYGSFTGPYFSLVPTMGGAAISGAVTYFSTMVGATDTTERLIYAKALIDDTEPLDGAISSVELHLRTTHPSPRFVASSYQWIHLASVLMEATPLISQHTSGSLWLARNGGPGSFFYPYTP